MEHEEHQRQERDEQGFFFAINKMAQEVKKRDDFVVVHHHDADGCCSGAITIKALERLGKKVQSKCLKQLYRENIPEIKALGENFLFVDFGSGQLDYLNDAFGENYFVLDHHQPLIIEGKTIQAKWHINPLLYGINGGTEVSGAGAAFFFAMALDGNNFDLSTLAIVGALGDLQDFNPTATLIGLNRKIVEIATEKKLIEIKKDLRLYGRISRPLVSFLMYSTSPILPGLTANEDGCRAFLQQLDIPLKDPFTEEWISYEDLPGEKKLALTSALIILLAENNLPEWKIKELVGDVYTIKKEAHKAPLRDAKEFSTLLNACGRNKHPEIAVAVCLGDRKDAYSQAIALMDTHRANLRKGIEFINSRGVDERKSYYFIDANTQIDESIIGIIAGMLYGSTISETKPIVALARNNDGTVKLSSRGTMELVRRGLNLGGALKEASKKIEGAEGGGHKIAAGAKIPQEKVEEFLLHFGRAIEQQLSL